MPSLQIETTERVFEKKIGTVTAVSIPSEFQFQISTEAQKPLLQDFVVTPNPLDENLPLIAKIVRISRFNPLLPQESALELAKMTIDESLAPLALYGKIEMVSAACQVLGSLDQYGKLVSPGFPVKPGSPVYLPTAEFMQKVMGSTNPAKSLLLGCLRNRADIPSVVNTNEILNKHLAILAMTGSGKTYACSVILEELMKKGYPLLIVDPHADYLNISERIDKNEFEFNIAGRKSGKYKITSFDRSVALTELSFDQFLEFVEALSEEEVSSAQHKIHKDAFEYARKNPGKKDEKTGILGMFDYLNSIPDDRSKSVVLRQLGRLKSMLSGVDATLTFDEIVRSIGPGRGVVLNMSSLPSAVQSINVQIVLERLFEMRKSSVTSHSKGELKTKTPFPPLFVVVEEAHNYAPAQTDGEIVPSRSILRRIATEGRKFGFGLCVISQRPSRLDSTVLSQCNSQLILRIVNPNDQIYIRSTVESLAETDLLALPDLSQGEALLSGAMTTIPSLIKIQAKRKS